MIVQSCDTLEIFELIVTDEIVDHIVTYSNLYANQSTGNKEFKKISRLCKWEGITAPEIRLYLAKLIYRKTICIILKTNFLRPQALDELLVLLEIFLHLVDNEELGDSYNKAVKIQPILEKLVKRFKLLYDIFTIYPLTSPFSCGRDGLVGNNTFLKRDHVSDWKH